MPGSPDELMQRRSFLGSILALAAAPAIVRADSLMLVIPRETDILTADFEYGVYGVNVLVKKNTLLTPEMITREALRVLHQKLSFVNSVNTRYNTSWNSTVAVNGDKTLKICRPQRYMVT
jgi:hypothetical protein